MVDYPTVASYRVMSSRPVVFDEKVVLSGRVPQAAEVRALLVAVPAE